MFQHGQQPPRVQRDESVADGRAPLSLRDAGDHLRRGVHRQQSQGAHLIWVEIDHPRGHLQTHPAGHPDWQLERGEGGFGAEKTGAPTALRGWLVGWLGPELEPGHDFLPEARPISKMLTRLDIFEHFYYPTKLPGNEFDTRK